MFEKKSARLLAGLVFLRMIVFLFRAPTDLLLRNPIIGVFLQRLLPPSCFHSVFVTVFFDACFGDVFFIAISIISGAALIKSSLPSFFAAGRKTRRANGTATRPIPAAKAPNHCRVVGSVQRNEEVKLALYNIVPLVFNQSA